MTQEPDEALLWARNAAHEENGYHNPHPDFIGGHFDEWEEVAHRAEAYRAGQAAAEARIKELEEYLAAVVMDVQSRNKGRVLANVYEMSVPIRAKMKGGDA